MMKTGSYAGGWHPSFKSRKMNKNPWSESKLLPIGVGNLFILCTWFVKEHGLRRIHKSLTLAMVIAFALQTGGYFIEETIITGKNGGALETIQVFSLVL